MLDVPKQLPDDEFALVENRDVAPKVARQDLDGLVHDLRYAVVESLPALIQLVGYLKYKYSIGNVLLRGQTSLYPRLSPSLFRPDPRSPNMNRKNRARIIGSLVARSATWTCDHRHHRAAMCPEKVAQPRRSEVQLIASGTPRYAVEPLLQHYGIRTRWLDVVDNLWVALWFACHRFVTVEETFQHVVRRVPEAEAEEDRFAYLLVVLLMDAAPEVQPGLFRSAAAGTVVDLRRAVPSFYLRPHAQHGLLVHPFDDDASNLTVVPIKIRLRQALEWLGDSLLLSDYGLFPPATVDVGYRKLLRASAEYNISPTLGRVVAMGPGY
ncbi:FRG domain-containing protein [Nocardioides sp.]|uniref:FRG domain-containing protein n=1 Tax=Nocardioides sp. TaxID=35761 RepID=UPI00378321F4